MDFILELVSCVVMNDARVRTKVADTLCAQAALFGLFLFALGTVLYCVTAVHR